MNLSKSKKIILVGAALLSLGSCQKNDQTFKTPFSALESRGRGVYISNCIACHNPNPSLAGSIGPAIAGSGLDLITHKVLSREYPPGYIPKRKSEAMPEFPQLKNDIAALYAYINTFK